MKTLNDVYEIIDSATLEKREIYDFTQLFIEIRDGLINSNQRQDAQLAQFEIDFLNFRIIGNDIHSNFKGNYENGDTFEYPTFKNFTKEQFNYLISRQEKISLQSLKARYSHLLWLSPKKNIKYAQDAIINYIEVINYSLNKDLTDKNVDLGFDILHTIQNALPISITTNFKVDVLKKIILKIILKHPLEKKSSKVLRTRLLDNMLIYKKVFDIEDFKKVKSIFSKLYKNTYADDSKHNAIEVAKSIIALYNKIGENKDDYERKIGQLWEELIIERADETNIISAEFCKNAIKQYKKVKDTIKVKELELKYNEFKSNIVLSEIGGDFDMSVIIQESQNIAKQVSKLSATDFFNYLITDKRILPTYEEIEKLAEKNRNQSFATFLSNTSIIDRYGNHSQYFNDDEEMKYLNILQSYQFSLQFGNLILIKEIFFSCIKKGTFNLDTCIEFLKTKTWLGYELKIKSRNGDVDSYCWLALIIPSLQDYFNNLGFYFTNNRNYPNFILAIDSLTLKIEGILRDLCEFKGITTFDLKHDKKGRTISQQRDIHKLLYDDELLNFITKDDILLLKFLLIEKAGFNLRHKIAHSLMSYNDYSLNFIHLVIISIFRLANYNFVKTNEENSK